MNPTTHKQRIKHWKKAGQDAYGKFVRLPNTKPILRVMRFFKPPGRQ